MSRKDIRSISTTLGTEKLRGRLLNFADMLLGAGMTFRFLAMETGGTIVLSEYFPLLMELNAPGGQEFHVHPAFRNVEIKKPYHPVEIPEDVQMERAIICVDSLRLPRTNLEIAMHRIEEEMLGAGVGYLFDEIKIVVKKNPPPADDPLEAYESAMIQKIFEYAETRVKDVIGHVLANPRPVRVGYDCEKIQFWIVFPEET